MELKNILRILADRGYKLTVFPAKTDFEEIMSSNPNGVFLSNGPGDPEPCDYAIEAIATCGNKYSFIWNLLGSSIISIIFRGKDFKDEIWASWG